MFYIRNIPSVCIAGYVFVIYRHQLETNHSVAQLVFLKVCYVNQTLCANLHCHLVQRSGKVVVESNRLRAIATALRLTKGHASSQGTVHTTESLLSHQHGAGGSGERQIWVAYDVCGSFERRLLTRLI